MKFNSGVWKTSVFAPLKHGSSEGSFSETCEFPGNGVFVHLSVPHLASHGFLLKMEAMDLIFL